MTEAEIRKLSKKDLLLALNEKAVIANLRTSGELLSLVTESLDPDTLTQAFVKNKFAPREAVLKYPKEFINQFIELNFNPGLEGILDLCGVSKNSELDLGIFKLINQFKSNKYDAGFIRSVQNLCISDSSLSLTKTLSNLIQNSDVSLILLEDIKKADQKLFVSIYMLLSEELKDRAAGLLKYESLRDFFSVEKSNERIIEFVLALWSRGAQELNYSDYNRVGTAFIARSSKLSDAEYMLILERLIKKMNHYESNVKRIVFRPCLESSSISSNYGYLFEGVPKDSRFYPSSFAGGGTELSAKDGFEMLPVSPANLGEQGVTFYKQSARYSSHSGLSAVLNCGTDAEMAEEIKTNSEAFLKFLDDRSVTPSMLKNSIPNRPLTAAAIFGIVPSSYRKQIATAFKDLKVESTKVPIASLHARVWQAMSNNDADEFRTAINAYEAGSFNENLTSFFSRQLQKTYANTYQSAVSVEFLKELKDEDLAMRLIAGSIKFYVPYNGKNSDFASAANAAILLDSNKFDIDDCLAMTYQKEAFIKSIKPAGLEELTFTKYSNSGDNNDNQESNLPEHLKAALEIAAKHVSGNRGEKIKFRDDDFAIEVAKHVDKKIFIENVDYYFIRQWDSEKHYSVTFKGGEKLSTKEIMEYAPRTSNPTAIIGALSFIEDKETLTKICKAVVDSKATAYRELFPNAGNRSSEMIKFAMGMLGQTGQSNNDDLQKIFRKTKNLVDLKSILGENYIDVLAKRESGRKIALTLAKSTMGRYSRYNRSEIIIPSKEDLQKLLPKYSLLVVELEFLKTSDINSLKNLIECEAEVGSVMISSEFDLSSKSNQEAIKSLLELTEAHGISVNFTKTNLFEIALIEGCSGVLTKLTTEQMCDLIINESTLLAAHKAGVPFESSFKVAAKIPSDLKMLAVVVSREIRFNDIIVPVNEWALDILTRSKNGAQDLAKAKLLGLNIVSNKEFERIGVYSKIFDNDGQIKQFEPMSIASIPLSERINLIKTLSEKNPKFKKLLGQDLESEHFVLCPADQIDKNILVISNIKDVLGFGIPGDMAKEEQAKLSDLLTARGAILGLAVRNLRNYLSFADISEVKFQDIFSRANSKVEISKLAGLMATKYSGNSNLTLMFETLLKNPSKNELLSFVKDGEEYDFSFLKDAAASFESVRASLNSFVVLLGDETINASTIFSAMAGDNDANAFLEEKMSTNDDRALTLKELSKLIKVKTVELSILRKRTRAGESVNLARGVHDLLGELQSSVSSLLRDGLDRKKSQAKSGFSKFNGKFAEKSFLDKKGNKTSVYFPETLADVRQVGATMKWCTWYNDHYFNNMISGSHILFNLKQGEKIVAQGEVAIKGPAWQVIQLRKYDNENAFDDYNHQEIIDLIKGVCEKDKSLAERYLLEHK